MYIHFGDVFRMVSFEMRKLLTRLPLFGLKICQFQICEIPDVKYFNEKINRKCGDPCRPPSMRLKISSERSIQSGTFLGVWGGRVSLCLAHLGRAISLLYRRWLLHRNIHSQTLSIPTRYIFLTFYFWTLCTGQIRLLVFKEHLKMC